MEGFGEFIGISDLHYALVTKDDATGYVAEKPKYLAPAANVLQAPSVATKTRYYDNRAMYTTSTEGETAITAVVSGVPIEVAAEFLGKTYDTVSKRFLDTGKAGAPWTALSFRYEVEGGVKYYQYLKGKFAPYNEEGATTTNDIDEKTTSLNYTAVVTAYSKFKLPDGENQFVAAPLKRIVADTRTDSTVTNETWFGEVQRLDDIEPPETTEQEG